jgi:AcrR family transcriptional regulator
MACNEATPGGGTRERLLQSACEVFAAKGYREATIAEICERAGANIAAVNYYFRDKASLYVEAWRVSFQESIARHPPDGGVPPDASAEERLCGRIRALVHRVADVQSNEFRIIHKELAQPTGLLAEVMAESINPIRQGLEELVRELIGPGASAEEIRLCQMSVRAQCFDIMIHRQRPPLARGPDPLPAQPLDVNVVADHIARFSLAGIRDMRQRIMERRSATQS